MTPRHAPPVRALTALFGGASSIFTAAGQLFWMSREEGRNVDVVLFFETWSLVFLATASAHVVFVSRRNERVFAAGRLLIWHALAPGFLAGAAIGACLSLTTGLPLLPAVFWVTFYGLALTGAVRSAPSSLIALGWAFLLTGLAAFYYLMYESIMPEFDLPTPTRFYAAALMGGTFGAYHLLYAACVWRGQAPVAAPR